VDGPVRVLVTGASGFVGRRLVGRLAVDGHRVRAGARLADAELPPGVESIRVGDLAQAIDWRGALTGVERVVHTAARVHVMHETAADPLAEFRRVNREGTVRLAEQSAAAGVRRFVFVSSIKVNGERSDPRHPLGADDPPSPSDPYGISKLEAEEALLGIARTTGMEVAIVRPVLVYGPGVKGNFLSMLEWLEREVPLPLASIDNRRSLVALDNLVDLIGVLLDHPAAANQRFMVSDGADLSTPDLLRRTAAALGRRARLFRAPTAVLRAAAAIVGRSGIASRLCDSLQVDIDKNARLLRWTPPVDIDSALAETARDYLARRRRGDNRD
jgi:UDP-4-keto-D-QuiNAc 4-reductase